MEFIDDGKYKWQDVFEELDNYYINVIRINKNNNEVYNDLKFFKDFIYDTIHNKLFKNRDVGNNENEIRKLVKYVIYKILPFINEKIKDLNLIIKSKPSEENAILLNNFFDLEDDFYAIASFRSLIHYAHYMERQDDVSQLVWKYNMNDTMGSIFYYSNSMILNSENTYQNLIKQCPTGYGKSKSDCVIITFCFGYDINDDIMKVVGNRTLVKPITQSIVSMIKSKNFRKVFPQYNVYEKTDDIFETCSIVDGAFKLKGSKKATSFACFNKDTPIDGSRFNKQFYDDITQSDDRENVNAHYKDRNKFDSQWKKRQYDELSCKRWFTGTAYHREDFLSYISKYYSENKELIIDENTKKSKWNKFVRLNSSKTTVYIKIPKLADLELGEDKAYCTFPQKYSKVEAIKELHSSQTALRRFMAMEQQEPMPPESLAFDWLYLRQYKVLPQSIKEGKCDTFAIIDPNRKGKDNYACLIFKKPLDENLYYLVDCYYKKVSSKIAIPKIIERIKHHKVDIISFENNTADDYLMKQELNSKLSSVGYKDYKIDSVFSTKNKEEKISTNRDDIRELIVFPCRGMYYEDSDMGRALCDIVNYSFEGKNGNDDSIDCCAMLIEKVNKKTKNSISSINFHL